MSSGARPKSLVAKQAHLILHFKGNFGVSSESLGRGPDTVLLRISWLFSQLRERQRHYCIITCTVFDKHKISILESIFFIFQNSMCCAFCRIYGQLSTKPWWLLLNYSTVCHSLSGKTPTIPKHGLWSLPQCRFMTLSNNNRRVSKSLSRWLADVSLSLSPSISSLSLTDLPYDVRPGQRCGKNI